MYELFPIMSDKPERDTVIGGSLFWVIYLLGGPFFVLLLMFGKDYIALPVVILYTIFFISVAIIFRRYLIDSFLNVRYYTGRFFMVVGIATGMIVMTETIIEELCLRSDIPEVQYVACNILPFMDVPEMFSVYHSLLDMPVWMIICTSIFTPVVICCLFYGIGFAPVAVERPWLGYLLVAVLAAIPRLIGLCNTDYPLYQFIFYLAQLPWHFFACWAYQKADTIWAPICTYASVNLLTSLYYLAINYLFG